MPEKVVLSEEQTREAFAKIAAQLLVVGNQVGELTKDAVQVDPQINISVFHLNSKLREVNHWLQDTLFLLTIQTDEAKERALKGALTVHSGE